MNGGADFVDHARPGARVNCLTINTPPAGQNTNTIRAAVAMNATPIVTA